MKSFGLIIVGDEILSGKREDKHLAKVISLLGARGLSLCWARYLGDDRERLTQALRDAFASGDIVFSCGGIGATPDDHTRQAVAAALGRPLELHPGAATIIIERMQQLAKEKGEPYDPVRAQTPSRMNMGVFPQGATLIDNPFNRIPGFSVGDVHFVPGFPVMAHPMIESLLDTRYAHMHQSSPTRERSFIVRGAMEATLTPLMEQLEAAHPEIKVFSLPSVDHPTWGRHIELGVKGQPDAVDLAFESMRAGLLELKAEIGTELVR